MAAPFYSSSKQYPLPNKPQTSPDSKDTYQDIFNLIVSVKSLLRDLDSLFLGGTANTPPQVDDNWIDVGAASDVFQDSTEQAIYPAAAGAGTQLIMRGREDGIYPYKFTALIHSPLYVKENLLSGICIRNPVTDKIYTIGKGLDGIEVSEYADDVTHTVTLASVDYRVPLAQWYRILNTGSSCDFQFSADGSNWITLHSMASQPDFTFTGFWCSPENLTSPEFENPVRCFSWRVEKP